ncbi:uncharacterized protein BP5553_02043 [Venustampulla echinocandica]|uniref:NADP-dependent oxidoreductase domain-containing protein n=1 Tax=Venustampulla echinocandica TaxID=2656787 RepID=A0A370U2Q1_9HELO|nr:uncharacterized protein BP5553_02043 [Venustampulla echinocandica]RDL42064.1 hypothetical protein BP5553_02043 [Venustampulla echinocandica]
MAPTQPPLSAILPPLICGTGTFNSQYNADAFAVPANQIVQRSFELGVRAFDTSPYYGPSEAILGAALNTPHVLSHYPRSSYYIVTKVGRIAASEFDYSPEWIRRSIKRSLQRLHTSYLDVVYCHDVEFVTPAEVLVAVQELRRIRDVEGTIKYIGISGYPVPLLCELAELVLRETGEPLDAVMSYANLTLQNSTLASQGVERLKRAGVSVVPSASPLGMGLLRNKGVPVGGMGDFHPAPRELRCKVLEAARFVGQRGEKLEAVALSWALDRWVTEGAALGTDAGLGVSVMGPSDVRELEEIVREWNGVLDGLDIAGREVGDDQRRRSLERRKIIAVLATGIWDILGEWRGYTWASPDKDYVNVRVKEIIDLGIPVPEVKGHVRADSRL